MSAGTGEAVVLLHGIGMSGFAWSPVVPLLAETRRVVAFDLPGFGGSAALPEGVEPSPAALAASLADGLRAAGVGPPVDLVGNSLGGLVALEAAKMGLARSVVAISPAGLWGPGRRPERRRFFALEALRRSGLRLSARAVRHAWVRRQFLGVPLSPRAASIPPAAAARIVADFSRARAFLPTYLAAVPLEGGGRIPCPVTVAFGTDDRLLGPDCRSRHRLPPHTVWHEPPGWGHVPMWDDPTGVADLILGTTS